MLEIKTIVKALCDVKAFDDEVNYHINADYVLNTRQIIPIADGAVLYAELERITDEDEEEDEEEEDMAIWSISRIKPSRPYACSKCGFSPDMSINGSLPKRCPSCGRAMCPPIV